MRRIGANSPSSGLLAAPLPEAHGGLGGGAVDTMVIMEEFGKALVVEPYVPTVVVAGGTLARAGSEAQKQEWLPKIAGGEAMFAFAFAEPAGRYNLADLRSTAKKQGSGYVLNGHKAVVIGAPWADALLVTARTAGGERNAKGIGLFLVDKKSKGVSLRDFPTVDGARASEITFENVELPASSVIGSPEDGLALIERATDEAIAAHCAEAVGCMKVLLEATVAYSKSRKQFGLPIGKFQALAAPHGRHVRVQRTSGVCHADGDLAAQRSRARQGRFRRQSANRQGGALHRPASNSDSRRHGHDRRAECRPLFQALDDDRHAVRQRRSSRETVCGAVTTSRALPPSPRLRRTMLSALARRSFSVGGSRCGRHAEVRAKRASKHGRALQGDARCITLGENAPAEISDSAAARR